MLHKIRTYKRFRAVTIYKTIVLSYVTLFDITTLIEKSQRAN